MITLRYDLRCPDFAETDHAEMYATMLDQCQYGDEHGFTGVTISEHHGVDDGFCSSPLTVAAAVAGRTKNVMISISALLVPLHDPLRLAEDIAALDLLSGGRTAVIAALGYRDEEFEMFGADRSTRGRDLEEAIAVMRQAWTGEPFEYRGRTARVTPKPLTQPHPLLMVGGSVPASAKRAARLGLPLMLAVGDQELADLYYAEAEAAGLENPFAMVPTGPGFVHVTEDPERTWAELERHALFDAETYASWQKPDQRSSWQVEASDLDELKASGQYRVVTPDECVELIAEHGTAVLHPLMGGMSPELGWESVRLTAEEVLPRVGS